jgi:hypothetical protein
MVSNSDSDGSDGSMLSQGTGRAFLTPLLWGVG